jgi:hypothetical protein
VDVKKLPMLAAAVRMHFSFSLSRIMKVLALDFSRVHQALLHRDLQPFNHQIFSHTLFLLLASSRQFFFTLAAPRNRDEKSAPSDRSLCHRSPLADKRPIVSH